MQDKPLTNKVQIARLSPPAPAKSDQPNLDEIKGKVDALKKKGDYEKAEKLLLDALSGPSLSNETKSALYTELARLHNFFGKFEEALEASKRAVSLDRSNLPARLEKGKALLDLGRAKEAAHEFESIIKNWHSQIKGNEAILKRAYLGLAECYLAQNDQQKCIALCKEAQKIDPKFQLAIETEAIAVEQLYLMNPLGIRKFGEAQLAGQEKYMLRVARSLFLRVDEEELIRELSEENYGVFKLYTLAMGLKQKVEVLGAQRKIKEPMKSFELVKEVILTSYPPEHVPAVINAYSATFIRYVPDFEDTGEEVFRSPEVLLSNGFGDCDDVVVFADAIMTAANIPHKMITFTIEGERPREEEITAENLQDAIRIDPSHVTIVYELKVGSGYYLLDYAGVYDTRAESIEKLLKKIPLNIRGYRVIKVDLQNHTYEVIETVNY
jgi:tetratricopeptide (TPR) repeat protein